MKIFLPILLMISSSAFASEFVPSFNEAAEVDTVENPYSLSIGDCVLFREPNVGTDRGLLTAVYSNGKAVVRSSTDGRSYTVHFSNLEPKSDCTPPVTAY